MKHLSVLVKPVSGSCQLRCRYCFYRNITQNRETGNYGLMTEVTADALIRAAFQEAGPNGTVQFTFQGGEPTLAGLGFYRRFMELEAQYRKGRLQVSHSIQTNGLLLDEAWAVFLKKHNFLVGLSLDGTPAIHDAHRVDASNIGTWARVLDALALLKRHNVETSLLCVISAAAAKKPAAVYNSMKQLYGQSLQFIPCLDPLDSTRSTEPYSLKPEAYARFLCQLFDCWYRDWKKGNYYSIRNFEDYIRILMGMPPAACALCGMCGSYLVAESDGSLFPCDFYVLDEWRIGNIKDCTFTQAFQSDTMRKFVSKRLPEECSSCSYFPLCRGGCQRDRMPNGSNYYCSVFKAFLHHSLPRLQEIAHTIR